ncbi:hypothetical protein BJ138DRAFT_1125357 [Hygrophoropsis aurantiaca]|uniref:Uncharacterized protein n=1 Tax=Hygrophoropsis aurantiaca TaxID=72124 RepID=A0ACB8AH20_9AGAM|nr:hypothetical protein BJ138DRAFT_1125357 [Hygrophoropsis aurantiaca]
MAPIILPDLKHTRNIVVFAEIAKTSPGAADCTLDAQDYSIIIDQHIFRIFDTVGLNEPQIRTKGYLDAIEKAYHLVTSLTNAGGIHLLLFVIGGGGITETMQQNYRLFYEFLCHKKVPVALVFTHLEYQERMEDWWDRNSNHFKDFGINTDAHVCITGVRGIQDVHLDKYNESVKAVHQLLMTYGSGSGSAFSMEKTTWVARILRSLRKLVNNRKFDSKKDMKRTLIKRCGVEKADAEQLVARILRMDSDKESIFPDDETLYG